MPIDSNKVTADSYGRLQGTESIGKECWLLRIPPTLAKAFEECPEGTVLGELVFRKGGGPNKVKPSLEVHVAQSLASSEQKNDTNQPTLPLQYSLQAMTKKLPTLHPFTRHPNGSIQLHGTVTRTANLQVHQDATYRALCKNRILASAVHNNRFVKSVEANQVIQQTSRRTTTTTAAGGGGSAVKNKGGGGGFGDAVHQFGKRLLEAQQNQSLSSIKSNNKKARFTEDQPLKSIIFQLYQDKPFWTTKDLRAASGGRSETEIKRVLQEIATYHRSGEQKNTWELRQEYQKSDGTNNNNNNTNNNNDGTNNAPPTSSGDRAGGDGGMAEN
jgi:TFIIF, beta subunit HTH domain/TFIIF, beta subunit N-terminus